MAQALALPQRYECPQTAARLVLLSMPMTLMLVMPVMPRAMAMMMVVVVLLSLLLMMQ